jgi:membrane protease YdiL (CAAX protease family)
VVLALCVLVAANLLNNRLAVSAYVVTSLVAVALLLVLVRLSGGGWADTGLGRDALERGARWALILVAAVAAGYLVGALVPATRVVFLDRRVDEAGLGSVAYQMLVRIPLGTVLLEEIGFRGVLYGLVRRAAGAGWATAVSSTLFGLWHVFPALHLVEVNPVAREIFAGDMALAVVGAVVATGLAGVLLCELRRRSGSLLPCLGVHWATNALGYLTAWLVLHSGIVH